MNYRLTLTNLSYCISYLLKIEILTINTSTFAIHMFLVPLSYLLRLLRNVMYITAKDNNYWKAKSSLDFGPQMNS